MYIEQYSNDPSKYEEDAQKALAPIIKVRPLACLATAWHAALHVLHAFALELRLGVGLGCLRGCVS